RVASASTGTALAAGITRQRFRGGPRGAAPGGGGGALFPPGPGGAHPRPPAGACEGAAEWRPLGWAGPLFPRRARAEHTVEQSLARRLRRPVAVDVDN